MSHAENIKQDIEEKLPNKKSAHEIRITVNTRCVCSMYKAKILETKAISL